MKKLAALLAGAMLMMATSAMATPLGNGPSAITSTPLYGQPSLQSIADTVLGAGIIDVANNQTGVGVWAQAENDVSAFRVTYALGSGGAPIPGNLGIYSYANPAKTWNLMNVASASSANFKIKANGTLQVNNVDVDSGWSNSFGYYFILSDKTLFTEDDKNSTGENMAATYVLPNNTAWNTIPLVGINEGDSGLFLGGNDWLLAFEYNAINEGPNARDFNDGVFLVEDMAPVPEPGTMVLLGAGLLGLAIYGKRRMNKEA